MSANGCEVGTNPANGHTDMMLHPKRAVVSEKNCSQFALGVGFLSVNGLEEKFTCFMPKRNNRVLL
jgi:hypothetical protein